ncbi:MAG: DUF1501 domain-containing protein, partial [Verrucomicrobiota bacterium]
MKKSSSQLNCDRQSDHPLETFEQLQTRRQFLRRGAMGLGAAVLGNLSLGKLAGTQTPVTHFAPRARRVIFLFMAGAPSQLDLFDYKPDLHRQFNQPLPPSV